MAKKYTPPKRSRRKYSARKDTRKWCRGKPGIPHKPVIVKVPWGQQHGLKCKSTDVMVGWRHCWHQIECAVCGKFIADVDPADCPELKDADAGEDNPG